MNLSLFSFIFVFSMSVGATTIEHIKVFSDVGYGTNACVLKAELISASSATEPLVIISHDSGAMNRNGDIASEGVTYHPYLDIASYLSNNGVSSLRFDKRTSDIDCIQKINYVNFSPRAFIGDIESLIFWVKNNESTKHRPIVLLGHGQSANFVVEIANRYPEKVSAVILMAGLIQFNIDVTLLRQFQQVVDTSDDPHLKQIYETLYEQGSEYFSKLQNGQLTEQDSFLGAYATFWADWNQITGSAFFETFRLNKPTLIMQGSLDTKISVADFRSFEFIINGRKDSKAMYYEGVGHEFMSLRSPYTVDELVLRDLVSWTRSLR